MKFKCCENLMHHLVFAQADVMACCCARNHQFIKFYKQENKEEFDIDSYKQVRTYYIDLFKNNIIPDGCNGCPFIIEKDWDEEIKYKNIIISNHTKCSCNCIYCSLLEGEDSLEKKKELNTRKTYDAKSILQSLNSNGYINYGCNVQIAGGEPTEYPKKEFDWLLDFASQKKCNIEVLSSGINYSKVLEKSLKKDNIRLLISPDTAIKETYEKIKRIRAYDKVWNNIKKYIKAAEKNPNASVCLKFIILPGVNDNKKEISSFIDKCKSLNCNNIIFSFDFNCLEKYSLILDSKISYLICYVFSLSKKDKSISFEPQVRSLFMNIYNKYNHIIEEREKE